MANIIRYDSKPDLEKPVFIECLPGIGNVGKIAGDFIADSVCAKKFASIYSRDFPPQVIPDEECVIKMACNELWYAKNICGKDIIFLRGDYQGSTAEGQFELSQDIMDMILPYDPSMIMTLGGYGTGTMVDTPRVLGAVSRSTVRTKFEEYGVVFSPHDPQAGIVGASGILLGLGQLYGIDSICLMGETSGFFMDHKSAFSVVKIISEFLEIKPDTTELSEKSDQIDALTAKVKEFEEQDDTIDLGYIG